MGMLLSYYLTAIILYIIGVYFICLRFKNFSLIDIAWGLGFVLIVILSLNLNPNMSAPQYLLGICVFTWGARLSAFLFLRNFGKEEDFRYKEMRTRWGKSASIKAFYRIFLLQGSLIFVIGLPIILALNGVKSSLGFFQIAGFLIWGAGFIWESWADQVKSQFKGEPGNIDRPCNIGPWKYSQYANYFGEVLLWWGLYLISLPHDYFYLSIISPALITFLILKVSGIPYLEEKNKDRESYKEYRRVTNKFIPGKPKS